MNKVELAHQTCVLEIEKLRAPIGRQDQYATAYGDMNYIEFAQIGLPSVVNMRSFENREKMKWLQSSTMLFYLNGRSSNDILAHHEKNIESKTNILNDQKKLARELVIWLHEPLLNGRELGMLVTKSWECKKKMTPQATTEGINQIMRTVLDEGAFGAKLCGAGGGGFLLVICDPSRQQRVRTSLSLQEMKFNVENKGTEMIYADK
jgi:D-glycero-alpha-D-manno-heptose-7-phosphate kinase